jgi:N-methylhydantoinase A/oxoprolinase/acetone carboxylase beta subunit
VLDANLEAEAVNWRVTATAPRLAPSNSSAQAAVRHSTAIPARRRVAFGPRSTGEAPAYRRNGLAEGFEAQGPLVVEDSGCTIVVGPDAGLRVDRFGNMILTLAAAAEAES